MEASRRQFLKASALVGMGSGLAGCAQLSQKIGSLEKQPNLPAPKMSTTPEERLLGRCGFGAAPETLAKLRTQGKQKFIEEQLKGAEYESIALKMQLQPLDVLQLTSADLRDTPLEAVLTQLQQAAILQAVYGRNQLRERMVDFWSNHFNIYARKGNTGYAKGGEEFQLIRTHALGKFPEMLFAMAHSPAMLEFLDNQQNRKGVANENYARELMELHTLGLQGGYTQKDVQEVARCFTGWTVENRFLRPRGEFRFDPEQHDAGEKMVLGHRIPAGGGEDDAQQVLSLLAMHPSTAQFLSSKLCHYFLGELNERWIGRMSRTYLNTAGSVAATIEPLLLSEDLIESQPILKRPFDFMISSLRYAEADTDGSAPIQQHLARMGEPLYQWPMPDGYPDKTSSWTSSLLPRWNFAVALASGRISRTYCSNEDPDSLALTLASPDFQWR